MVQNVKLVPPDGGYGWVIVAASALSNFVSIPLLQGAGLIFKDAFIENELSATQGSLIINVNSAFGMLTGLVNGPLLNHFGYRKISFAGAFCLTFGVILTSFARTFWHFIIAYGCITSLGLGLTMSSFSLAINTYFFEKKNRAIGIGMTLTGFGPIIMPQIINLLIQHHTVYGVTLILGAIMGHSLVAASLLQPVKWHMKKQPIEEEAGLLKDEADGKTTVEEDEKKELEDIVLVPSRQIFKRSASEVETGHYFNKPNDLTSSKLSINHENEAASIYGFDSTLGGSVLSLESATIRRRPSVISNHKAKLQWGTSQTNLNNASVNLHLNEDNYKQLPRFEQDMVDSPNENPYNPDMTTKNQVKPVWKQILHRIVVIFDLNLLKDPIYVNIMLGMSLAVFAELNFSVLTAFILDDFGLTTSQIATFMSILGTADIIFRFLAPYIGDYLKFPARVMYMLTLVALIVSRFCLLLTTEFKILLFVAGFLGVAKGVRTVYMTLVIPMYVPLERLAAASGIQMMVNGFFILIGGPILGLIRDATGSYYMCIFIMNCVTFTAIIMWTCEMLIRKYRNKNKEVS